MSGYSSSPPYQYGGGPPNYLQHSIPHVKHEPSWQNQPPKPEGQQFPYVKHDSGYSQQQPYGQQSFQQPQYGHPPPNPGWQSGLQQQQDRRFPTP